MIFADLHLHSKYARAVSPEMTLEKLVKGANLKGLQVMGSGDFFHPKWQEELNDKLEQYNGSNLFKLKTEKNPSALFCLQTEIGAIYSKGGKVRKIHNLIYAPSLEIVAQLTDEMKKVGRVDYDGRPVFGMTCPELVGLCKRVSKDVHIIPAHAWTPYFGVFGSKSGFDSMEEAFEEKTNEIFAFETGLSSDPEMNWRVSKLDKFSLVSNSDAHSPSPNRIGRECNAFNFSIDNISYKQLFNSIKSKNPKEFAFTIEVDPSYGIYHVDGHNACNVSMPPKESKKLGNVCPVCKKTMTIGVLHRVEELADRPDGYKPNNAIPFKRVLPLQELLALRFQLGVGTKRVATETSRLQAIGSEFYVLLEAPAEELKKAADEKTVEIILNNRIGKIRVIPGFDGKYGQPVLDEKPDGNKPSKPTIATKPPDKAISQKSLNDY